MKIQIHNRLGNPQTIEVTRVVLLDANDNPLMYAVETEPGVILADQIRPDNEKEFNRTLRNLGISSTVIVSDVKQQPLKDITLPGY